MKNKRWVIKAGSNIVCSGGPLLIRSWMQQIAKLRRLHIEVVWVTSGAIASARDRISFRKGKSTLAEKQALSAIGQPIVMDIYNLALQQTGLLGAQLLLTHDDLANRARRKNFQNTVEELLDWGVTPILNENDVVSTEEITFGDNDSLSAKVAQTVDADRLLILTDVNGLYDSDPRTNPRARMIPYLDRVRADLLKKVGRTPGSSVGTGGMLSKLRAAQQANRFGIETWLVKGDLPSVLLDVARASPIGTQIGGKKGGSR